MSVININIDRDWKQSLLLNPALPLTLYFCISTLLALIAQKLTVNHPAYWIFAYLGICFLAQARIPRLVTVDFFFLGFVAVVFLSWMESKYTGGTKTLVLLLSSMIIPWVAARTFREADVQRFVAFSAISGGIAILVYFASMPFMDSTDLLWERVMFLGGAAYGVIGPTIGVLAVVSAVYLLRFNSLYAWAALPVAVVVIVHMGGRGMLVALLSTLLAACLIVRHQWKRKAMILGVVVVSLLVGLALVPNSRLSHFARLGWETSTSPNRAVNNTIAERRGLYGEAFTQFITHPLTGVGTGRFGVESSLKEPLTTPHSTVFQVLAELGLLGAVPFFLLGAVLLLFAVRLLASDYQIGALIAALWMYFVIYDQISANYITSLRYYLLSALLVTTYLHANKFFPRSP